MTLLEQRAMQVLPSISYAVQTWHQPRAHSLFRVFRSDPLWPLSTHELDDLWFIVWYYRRQVNDPELVARASEHLHGALALRW
jgi:hypothetical protein